MASCQGPRPIPFIRLCFYSSHWKGWWRHQLPVKSTTNLFREIQPIKLPSQIPISTEATNAQRPLMNCDFTITMCSTFTSSTITMSTKGDHVKTSSKQSRLFHWPRVSSVPSESYVTKGKENSGIQSSATHWSNTSIHDMGLFLLLSKWYLFLCVWVCCLYVPTVPTDPEKDGVIPGTEATNGYKLPGRYSRTKPKPTYWVACAPNPSHLSSSYPFDFFFRGRVSCTPRCLRLLLAPLYQTRSLSSKNGLTVLTLLLLPSLGKPKSLWNIILPSIQVIVPFQLTYLSLSRSLPEELAGFDPAPSISFWLEKPVPKLVIWMGPCYEQKNTVALANLQLLHWL